MFIDQYFSKQHVRTFAVLLCGCFFCISVLRGELAVASESESQSTLQRLSTHRVWLTLLHHEPRLVGSSTRSAITSNEFFLSVNGAESPLEELKTTVQALIDNEDAQCRYPARYLWLRDKIHRVSQIRQSECADYREWLSAEAVKSVSMVFATGHMKSPASYFGHNFLKFNGVENRQNKLLDETVNFGADVPDNEGGITYFIKGIFGGYQAVFEPQPFFRHMAKYGEEDLRDVWEYELNLNADEVELILAHTWELQKANLTYYFFRKNCAYQIAKLLALVTPAQLVPKHMPWTMPYNVFASLVSATIHGNPLVRDIRYHPSRRSRFHQRYFALTADDQQVFTRFVTNELVLNDPTFDDKSLASKLAIIDVLIDYYEFRLRLDDEDEVAANNKNKVLIKRFTLPVRESGDRLPDKPFPPHLAQRPGYLAVSALSNSKLGNGSEVRLRPSYFDFLSLDLGRSSSGNFTVFDTTVLALHDEFYVRRFDFLNVTNLAPSITGVTGDSGTSWHFRFGFDSTNNACIDCRRLMADWMIGKSTRLTGKLTAFALAGGRLQRSYRKDNTLVLKAQAGIAGTLLPGLRLHGLLERHEDTGRSGLDRNRLKLQLAFGGNKRWDVRFSYQRDVAEQLALSAGYYW